MRAVLLAAGQGKRMHSALPKVLYPLCGWPLIRWAMEAVRPLDPHPILVVGHGGEQVMAAVGDGAQYACQPEPLGTGHAVMAAREQILGQEIVLVLAGDMPLLLPVRLAALAKALENPVISAAVLTARLDDPTGYGRVVRYGEGRVRAIVEQRDADIETAAIQEVNTSVYAFRGADLLPCLDALRPDNDQGEYYLTDVIGMLAAAGKAVAAVECPADEAMGINDRAQLAQAARQMRQRINRRHMLAGVTLIDPETVFIDADVVIGTDTVIYPNNTLEAGSVLGEGCTILPGCRIHASRLGRNVTAEASVLLDATVGDGTTVGPFAYLRPGAQVGEGCRIGDFVELKNSCIGQGTKVSHLTYVGDADVGSRVNVGCGTVFVNYDGVHKHRSTVKDDAFIGCNTNLVAPVTVGEGAYTAAGSTITEDIPAGSLAIARSRQENKPGWVARKRKKQGE